MGKVYEIDKNKTASLFVLGDIHGDLESLESLVSKAKADEKMISLGDYSDRGPNNIEVIDRIRDLQNRGKLIPLKGNHEDYNSNGEPQFSPCHLPSDVNQKRESWITYFRFQYQPFVKNLYLAAILPGELLFVHGGICNDIKSIKNIEEQEKFILWADPSDSNGMGEDYRSGRPHFGPDVSKKVCESLGIKRIIRSHQPDLAENGPFKDHDGRVVTTSSTTYYKGKPFALRISTEKPQEYKVIFA